MRRFPIIAATSYALNPSFVSSDLRLDVRFFQQNAFGTRPSSLFYKDRSSFGKFIKLRQPSSVTMTLSSIRTPPLFGK